jgi:flagellar hook-length control protein FliK
MAPKVAILPSDPVAQVQPSELDLLEPAKDENNVLTSPSSTTSTTSVAAVTQTTAPTHQPTMAQQITTAIIQSAGRTTEISLNPEELGRVRISLTPADTGMTVTIISERLETADLMRRNIELLAREFTDLGYENLSFNFENSSEGGTGDGQPDDLHHTDTDPGLLPTDATQTHVMSATLSGGLDLKL